jgi:hypothetical protein
MKYIANNILNGERFVYIPLRSGAIQVFTISTYVVLEILHREIRQRNKKKGIKIGMEEVKLSIFSMT